MLRKLQTEKLAIVSFLVKDPIHKDLRFRNSIEYQIIANWKKAVFFFQERYTLYKTSHKWESL